MVQFINVLIPESTNIELLYKNIGTKLQCGDLVLVPLRRKISVGVVQNEVSEIDHIDFEIRNIVRNLRPLHLDENILHLINFTSNYCIIEKNLLLKLVLSTLIKSHKSIMKKNELLEKIIYRDNLPTKDYDITYSSEKLNFQQKNIFNQLIAAIGKYSVNVIDGATASGKTELYLELTKYILSKGGQVLILLPEILLTNQITSRIIDILSNKNMVHNWHSNIKQSEKIKTWLSVQNSDAIVVVGARSALFLPFKNLQMIIVDEEHDTSFKQENSPIYDAKNIAIARAKIYNIPILLVSATPSIETIYNVSLGKYRYFELPSRLSKKNDIVIANMWEASPALKEIKKDLKIQKIPMLHHLTIEKMCETIKNGKQILLFLNRKGYANNIFCSACMSPMRCTNCDARLVFYKHSKKLQCRHCDYVIAQEKHCKKCGSDAICMYHYGIEKLSEEVTKEFPDAKIMSISRDDIKSKESVTSIVKQISDNEVDIVIGTQIFAKGLHFKSMALCVIIDANSSNLGGEMRSYERTYQIFQQVMGRVGREEENDGTVIIQTLNKNAPIINTIVNGNKKEFFEIELKNREKAHVPPYYRMIVVSCSGKNEEKLKSWFSDAACSLPENITDVEILGPSPYQMTKLNKNYRYFILFKSKKISDFSLQKIVKAWLSSLKIPKNLKISVDVDPQ